MGTFPNVATQFKPGEGGGFAGRKRAGVRNKINLRFLEALAKDFEEHGADAIAKCRAEKPADYCRIVAGLLPAQTEHTSPLDDLPDAELALLIDHLRERLIESARAGAGETGEPQPTH